MHTHVSGIHLGRRGRVLGRTLRQVTGRTQTQTFAAFVRVLHSGHSFISTRDYVS